MQVKRIVQHQLTASLDDSRLLDKVGSRQYGRFHHQMTCCLTTIFSWGNDAEIDGFIGIIGRNDDQVAVTVRLEQSITLIAMG